MVKTLLTNYLKKTRDSDFQFDTQVTNYLLCAYLFRRFIALIRFNLHQLLSLRKINIAFIGNNVSIDSYRHLEMGLNSRIDGYCTIGAFGKNRLIIGSNSSIGSYSRIVVSSGFKNIGEFIEIGDHVGIGAFANIGGSGGVSIGNNTIIGPYFSAHPENHNYTNFSKYIRLQGTTRKPIVVKDNCWIGAKVTILAGVTIGKGSIIGAGAVVTHSIPEYSIALGNPAKVIKRRE